MRIAIVSPYPPPGTRHVYGSGVISYTKNLAEALRRTNSRIKIHVISDRRENLPRLYIDNNVVVHRVFGKNSLYILQVFKELCKIRPNIVHIQHEYFLYGGLTTAVLFPLLVALSKLISKRTIVTIHGVIPLKLLDDHEFRKENGIRGSAPILKLGLLLITKFITLFSDKVVVHEPFLKEYLVKDYREDPCKVVIIPHGIEDLKPLPKEEAKRKLGMEGKTILLYFGYLTGYKGIKELLDTYKEISKKISNTVLIIAGGPHPRLGREKWYRDWIRSILEKALDVQQEIRNNGKIVFTGYVPEDKIPLYFSAADIVVLPYKTRIAASGSEALAIAFERYCVFSNSIGNLEKEVLSVDFTSENLYSSTPYRKQSIKLKRHRIWRNIAKQYISIYYEEIKE